MAPKGKAQAGTVLDGLRMVYQDVANLALASDAGKYMQVVQGLQQALLGVIQKLTQAEAAEANQQQAQQIQQAYQGQPGMGGPGMGGPQQMGGPSMASSPGGPPPAQGSPGLAMPNSDELRRVLASQGAG